MQKNVSGQKWRVFAFDVTDNLPKTGDAANITANLYLDDGAANPVDDTNPTEKGLGYYDFDITQAETNANNILITPESATSNIQVIGVPGVVYTTPPNFPTMSIESDGDLTKVNTLDSPDTYKADVSALAVQATVDASFNALNDIATSDVLTQTQAALQGYNLDHLMHIAVDTDLPTTVHNNSVLGYLMATSVMSGFTRADDALEAIRARGDLSWITATGFSTHSAADIWAAGSRELSTPNNYKADISALALEATLIAMKGATFVESTDSLEALRDRGDAAWLSATGFSTHSAADIWSVTTRALTDKVDFALSSAGITAIWDNDISAYVGVGYAGTYIKTVYNDWLNAGRLDLILDAIAADVTGLNGDAMRGTDSAALASVCTETRLTELAAANMPTDIANVKTETALIVTDTNELQTDWADGGRLDLLLDAIKAKSDNLPSGLQKNVALPNFAFLMTDSTTNAPKAGLTVTVQLSKDGIGFTDATNTPALEIGSGAYKINLTQTERNADIAIMKATAADANQTTLLLISSA